MAESMAKQLEKFADILKLNEPLAPYTYLKLGGSAEALAQPRSREELAELVRECSARGIPLRILGGGCNVLVRDEGVAGVVLRLSEPAFTAVEVQGNHLHVGGGASLSSAISQAARHGLAGLETLVGIPGTVSGALCQNGSDRVAEIAQYVQRLEVVDSDGQFRDRQREEISLGDGAGNLAGTIIVTIELELEKESADSIVKRMRKAWIQRKAKQPLSFQAAVRVFKNPRGHGAASLIEQSGLAGTKVGGAQVSERDPNYIIAHAGTTARDVLRLVELIRSKVEERFNVALELEISVW